MRKSGLCSIICIGLCCVLLGGCIMVDEAVVNDVKDATKHAAEQLQPTIDNLTDKLDMGSIQDYFAFDYNMLLEATAGAPAEITSDNLLITRYKARLGEQYSIQYKEIHGQLRTDNDDVQVAAEYTTNVYSINADGIYFETRTMQANESAISIDNMLSNIAYVYDNNAWYQLQKQAKTKITCKEPYGVQTLNYLLSVIPTTENYCNGNSVGAVLQRLNETFELYKYEDTIYLYAYDLKGNLKSILNTANSKLYTITGYTLAEDVAYYLDTYTTK